MSTVATAATGMASAAGAHQTHNVWIVVAALALVPVVAVLLLRSGSRAGRRTPAMWLAGADPRHVPSTIERAFITSMGTMVALIACAAAASMTLAITIVAPGPWAWLYHLPVGVMWGLIVLTIDRWITSTIDFGPIDGEDGRRGRKAQAAAMLGRVAMAVVIGLLISEPIIFKLFDSEIQDQLRATHDEQIAIRTSEINREYQNPSLHPADPNNLVATAHANARQLANRLKTAQDTATTTNTRAICELSGVAGRPECEQLKNKGIITGNLGRGPETIKAQAAAEAATKALDEAIAAKTSADQAIVTARAAVEANTTKINQQRLDKLAAMTQKVNDNNGLLAREEALGRLSGQSNAALLTRLAVWAGFMLVDLLPLLLKVCSPIGEYRRLAKADAIERVRNVTVGAAERADEAAERERLQRAESLVTFQDRVAGDGLAERELATHERMLSLEYSKEAATVGHAARLRDLQAAEPEAAATDPADRRPTGPMSDDLAKTALHDPFVDERSTTATSASTSNNSSPGGGLDGMLVGRRWLVRRPLAVANAEKFPPWLVVDTFDEYQDEVVLKIIAPPTVSYRERRRAERELAVPKGFIHANLAEILDSGVDDEHGYFVVTRRFPETLQERLTKPNAPTLTLLDALDVTSQLLQGLNAAWSRDIVHLDVKPANIGIDEHGAVKLFDFGLRQRWLHRDQGLTTTNTNTPRFTPFYAPPEQMRGLKGWNERTADTRAVGAVLYWMLTGYPPMWREALAAKLITEDGWFASEEAPLRTKALIASTDPLAASALVRGLPAEVDRLLERWLDRDYKRRNPGNDARGQDTFAGRLLLELDAVRSSVLQAGLESMPVGRAVAASVLAPSELPALLPAETEASALRSVTAGDLPSGDWDADPFSPRMPDTEATDLGPGPASDDRLPDDLARYEGTMTE